MGNIAPKEMTHDDSCDQKIQQRGQDAPQDPQDSPLIFKGEIPLDQLLKQELMIGKLLHRLFYHVFLTLTALQR